MHRMHKYILNGHEPEPVEDLFEWAACVEARYMTIELGEEDPWRVAFTELPGGATVSTVFLCIDHNFWGGLPVLFETMLFGAEMHTTAWGTYYESLEQWRYHTWDEALAGHESVVALFTQDVKITE